MRTVVLFIVTLALTAQAQNPSETSIRHQLDRQTAAWNRGDVETFMTTYENSPQTTFVSDQVAYGYANILERYRKHYATPAAMGTLAFTHLAIRILDGRYAVATGNFHLERSKEGGGNADGIFSLLWRKGPAGWKIILDHTGRTHEEQ